MMWNDDYYHMIEKQFGSETMVKVANSHRTAIDFVEKVRMRPQTWRIHHWQKTCRSMHPSFYPFMKPVHGA